MFYLYSSTRLISPHPSELAFSQEILKWKRHVCSPPSDSCSYLPQKHVRMALFVTFDFCCKPLLSQIHLSCAALQFKTLKAQITWKNLHPGEFMNGVLAGPVTST